MGFGDVIGLAIAMGSLIAIIAIFMEAYKRRLAYKERVLELKGAQHTNPVDARIEERLRVLERIATDNPGQLAEQIEQLRLRDVVA